MREFVTRALDAQEIEALAEEQTTLLHDGREVTFNKPSTGQAAIMLAMGGREMDERQSGNFLALFFELMEDETYRYFNGRLMDRTDSFDLDSEGGIFDIWEGLAEEWSVKNSKKPSDYRAPSRGASRSSTAKSPSRVAPTRSRGRSTASSTPSTSGE